MTQKERMLAGLPYKSNGQTLVEERLHCKTLIFKLNHCPPDETQTKEALLKEIFGTLGKNSCIETPFFCDYGYNIEAGDNFFANYHCVILDVAKVRIGSNVMFGPNVSLYTAGHPIHAESRSSGYEYGKSIVIGDNVWLGGSTVINPGVKIGNNVLVASGSVVTKSLPDNVLAAGNPCRVLREITDEDRHFFCKKERFDVDDY